MINILYATSVSGGSVPPAFARMLALKIGLVVVMVALQAIDQLAVRSKRIEGLQTLSPEATALPTPLLKWQQRSQRICMIIMVLAVIAMGLGVTLTH